MVFDRFLFKLDSKMLGLWWSDSVSGWIFCFVAAIGLLFYLFITRSSGVGLGVKMVASGALIWARRQGVEMVPSQQLRYTFIYLFPRWPARSASTCLNKWLFHNDDTAMLTKHWKGPNVMSVSSSRIKYRSRVSCSVGCLPPPRHTESILFRWLALPVALDDVRVNSYSSAITVPYFDVKLSPYNCGLMAWIAGWIGIFRGISGVHGFLTGDLVSVSVVLHIWLRLYFGLQCRCNVCSFL